MTLKITVHQGMVDINGPDICYGNIKDMYKSGHGEGLQISEKLEGRKYEIRDLCRFISNAIYELDEIIGGQ